MSEDGCLVAVLAQMMKHKRPPLLGSWLLVLGAILLVLSACAPLLQNDPYTRWINHLASGDYNAAATITDVTAFPDWRRVTEQLGRQHQGVKSFQRSDLVAPPPGAQDGSIALITITWSSGF